MKLKDSFTYQLPTFESPTPPSQPFLPPFGIYSLLCLVLSASLGIHKKNPSEVFSLKEFKSSWAFKYSHEYLQYEVPYIIIGRWLECGNSVHDSPFCDIKCIKDFPLVVNQNSPCLSLKVKSPSTYTQLIKEP